MLSKKKIICLIVMLLVCIMVFSFCGCSAIKKKINDFVDDLEVTEEVTNNIVIEKTLSAPAVNGISMNISPMAVTSNNDVKITATVLPVTANNKTVDWQLSWYNTSTAYAKINNVNDYLSVVPDSDGSTTATVKVKNVFEERIKIICVSRDNIEIMTTCSVDYAKRLENAKVTLLGEYDTEIVSFEKDKSIILSSNDSRQALSSRVESVGTLWKENESFTVSVKLRFRQEFIERLINSSSFEIHEGKLCYSPEFGFRFDMDYYRYDIDISKRSWNLKGVLTPSSVTMWDLTHPDLKVGNHMRSRLTSVFKGYGGFHFDMFITINGQYSSSTFAIEGRFAD